MEHVALLICASYLNGRGAFSEVDRQRVGEVDKVWDRHIFRFPCETDHEGFEVERGQDNG